MEYKHFSHPHHLTFQQLQKGPEIICSGCKSPAAGDIYICWQCSFFLHEQCFKSSRALNHHSHPSHPLTLFPYPTYPSASFICNSCHQTGTGFSFSCSHCEFDLHVHCAYNSHTQTTPNESSSHPYYVPTQNYSSAPNETPTFQSQFPFPPPISTHESPFPGIPYQRPWNSNPTHEPYPNLPIFLICLLCTHPSKTYLMCIILHRAKWCLVLIPIWVLKQRPMELTCNTRYQMVQITHTNFNVVNPHQPVVQQPFQNTPNLNSQMRPESFTQEPVLNRPNIETQSNMNKPINISGMDETQQKLQGVEHFSHQHPLLLSNIKEADGIICSGCELRVSGSAYTCTISNCNFNLHNSCFGLPRELKHKSHTEHPLTLLSSSPYDGKYDKYACSACFEIAGAFVYHCSTCDFGLHVDCAFLPERIERGDHNHMLSLLYTSPFKKVKEEDPALIFTCDVCHATVDQRCWFYYCQHCDFGTHLGCVAAEQIPQEEPSEAVSDMTAMLETQAQLQRLQLQIKIATQTAQMIGSIAQGVSYLGGCG